MKIDKEQWKWTREPREFSVSEDKIEIITNPHTDLADVKMITALNVQKMELSLSR